MSNLDELKRFENDLKNNPELRKKLDEAFKRIVDEGKAQNDGEVMAAAAKELGYDVTVAALEQAKAEAETLDPEELEAVAGGKYTGASEVHTDCDWMWNQDHVDEYNHNGWCIATWHCLTAMLHTDSKEKDISCWSSYFCLLVNNHEEPVNHN